MSTIGAQSRSRVGRQPLVFWSFVAAAAIVAACAGLIGTYRYLDNYWLYRGYAPPHDPAYVTSKGTLRHISVRSGALGGRSQSVDVYLPPGYASHPTARYPVFYLLHGFPGRPSAFFRTVRVGVVEDILVAKKLAQPTILVAPFGSTGTFTDKEWANGVGSSEGWATFVARDLVRSIDRRYRTIRAASGRALGGLSEGGYGALNIAFHHPGEFQVIESWSGYELAANIASIFGKGAPLQRENSPLVVLPRVAARLRATGAYVWFYSGSTDRLLDQNRLFAKGLAHEHVAFGFRTVRGGHDWALWRGNAAAALVAASKHLSGRA